MKTAPKMEKPLVELARDPRNLWSTDADQAFKFPKKYQHISPVLRLFDHYLRICVIIVASRLKIELKWNSTIVIGKQSVWFAPNTSNSPQWTYTVYDLEIPGKLESLSAWGSYLHGIKFIVHADYYPLMSFLSLPYLSSCQARLLEKLCEFNCITILFIF